MVPQVSADLVDLRVFREGLYGLPDPPADAPRWIYRVYAEFSDPTDAVVGWGIGTTIGYGSQQIMYGPGQIRNITADGAFGTGFINIPDNDTGNLAPNNPLTVRDWDTYATIGLVFGGMGVLGIDASRFLAGSPTFISQGTAIWTGSGGGVLLQNMTNPQGRPDFIHLGNDTTGRTLLMQLVVNAGEHVEGTIGVFWRTDQYNLYTTTGLTFSSVPEPAGAVSLLALAAARRKRR